MQRRREVVRVRDDDSLDTAKLVDLTNGLVVDVGDAVPQDVARAVRGAEEKGALADGDLRLGTDGDDTRMILVLGEDIGVLLRVSQLTKRGEPLPWPVSSARLE